MRRQYGTDALLRECGGDPARAAKRLEVEAGHDLPRLAAALIGLVDILAGIDQEEQALGLLDRAEGLSAAKDDPFVDAIAVLRAVHGLGSAVNALNAGDYTGATKRYLRAFGASLQADLRGTARDLIERALDVALRGEEDALTTFVVHVASHLPELEAWGPTTLEFLQRIWQRAEVDPICGTTGTRS